MLLVLESNINNSNKSILPLDIPVFKTYSHDYAGLHYLQRDFITCQELFE